MEKNKVIFKNMKEHCIYVYENLIFKNDIIKDVYFIYLILYKDNVMLFNGRIKKIGFTDGLQGGAYLSLSKDGIKQFRKISRNYIASKEKKGKFLETESGFDVYSSGVNKMNIQKVTSKMKFLIFLKNRRKL